MGVLTTRSGGFLTHSSFHQCVDFVGTGLGQCGGSKASKGAMFWQNSFLQGVHGRSLSNTVSKYSSDLRPAQNASVLKLKRRNNKLTVKCTEEFKPHPFDPKDYVRVQLKLYMEPQDGRDRYQQGNLILTKEGESIATGVMALIMQVGGDTLSCLNSITEKRQGDRPMALDLLFSVLERAGKTNSQEWGVLRVAVVGLKNNVFHGRLFFGDTSTGKTVWDADCRPSDGSWVAQKYNAPLYVHKDVWKECARELSLSTPPEKKIDSQMLEENIDPNDPYQVSNADFEVIKLLKREMQVALREENYNEAARIRDHPFLTVYMRMIESKAQGRTDNARELQKQLEEMINESEKRRVEEQ